MTRPAGLPGPVQRAHGDRWIFRSQRLHLGPVKGIIQDVDLATPPQERQEE
jgi:hypothetical protein